MSLQPTRNFKYYSTLVQDLAYHAIRRWQHRKGLRKEILSGLYEGPQPRNHQILSTCIISMNGAERLGPVIQHARLYSDEIVIGVDSKTTDNTFEVASNAGADRVFWIENNSQTCNAGLEDLVKACSGDWIVRLDDDEFFEPQFMLIKDKLMAQNHITHYKFPRLHIHQINPLRWINDGYLYPDYQMRLFKNDLSLLHFPGAVGHTQITSDGPKGRIFGTNIIHLNLAINSREKREQKLQRYIARHNGEWVHPINEFALLYENFHYRVQPYTHPDEAFCQMLTDMIMSGTASSNAYSGEPARV